MSESRFEKYTSFLPYCIICKSNSAINYLRFRVPTKTFKPEYSYICFSCCFDIKIAYDRERVKEKEKQDK